MRRQIASAPRPTAERRSRRRRRLGATVVAVIGAVSLLAAAPGLAGVAGFDDVDETRFFADAVEWAKTNGITTGSPAGSSTFKPFDPVTRGENVTFAQRYDENVVQPALDDRYTIAQTDAAILAARPVLATAIAGDYVSTTSLDFAVIDSMTTTFTVPPGSTHDALVTFSANSLCLQDPVVSAWCIVAATIDGVPMDPFDDSGGGVVFDSIQHGSNSTDTVGWGSHSRQWVAGPLEGGDHVVNIQWRVDETNAMFIMEARTLSVLSVPSS